MSEYDKADALFKLADRWEQFMEEQGQQIAENSIEPDEPIPNDLDEAIETLGEIATYTGYIADWKRELQRKDNEKEFVYSCDEAIGDWIRSNWGLDDKKGDLYSRFCLDGIGHRLDITHIILTTFYRRTHNLPEDFQGQKQHWQSYWWARNIDPVTGDIDWSSLGLESQDE